MSPIGTVSYAKVRVMQEPKEYWPCDLHRLLAQAKKACTRSRSCITLIASRAARPAAKQPVPGWPAAGQPVPGQVPSWGGSWDRVQGRRPAPAAARARAARGDPVRAARVRVGAAVEPGSG